MDRLIILKDLPAAVLDSLRQKVWFHTVGFLRLPSTSHAFDPQLLGSGVLVSASSVKAILTAGHVVEQLPSTGRIGLFMQAGTAYESIDAAGVTCRKIRGDRESEGPDLGVVVLAPTIAGTVGARKSFYNLDTKRAAILNEPPDVHAGFWAAQGFLEEKTTLTRGPGAIDLELYNFTAVGGPDEIARESEYDYVDFLVSHEARPTAPVSWGGMSGSGLWQIALREVDDEILDGRPVLSGVLFYQYPTSDTISGVKRHAWRSVYDMAYDLIVRRE